MAIGAANISFYARFTEKLSKAIKVLPDAKATHFTTTEADAVG